MKKLMPILVVGVLAVGVFSFWQLKKPIKIAFVGELSTSSSQLSVESREAFLYTVDYYNALGGINGHKIAPYVYDDENRNDYKAALNEKLKADDIHLIVGFNVSAMAETIEYLMANGDYLIISPTVTTDYMTGRDDRFIKTSPTNALQIEALFKAVEAEDIKKMVIVYNEPNKLFSQGIVDKMVARMTAAKREVVAVLADSGEVNTVAIEQAIKENSADGLFLVMNGNDTAQVVQASRIGGFTGPILTSAWAATADLIENSGKHGEGVYSVEILSKNPDKEAAQRLAAHIKETMGSDLYFSHTRSYNATKMLVEALTKSKKTDPESVKKTMLEIGTFQGAETQFTVDANGDTIGDYQLQQIQNGKYVRVR